MITKLYRRGLVIEQVKRITSVLLDEFNLFELDRAHENVNYSMFTRKTDQSTIYHEKFYKSFNTNPTIDYYYQKMIEEVRHDMFDCELVYQKVPTFRVHLPGNLAVGEFHRDTDYGHNSHAINMWVPFTSVWATNGVYIETVPGQSYETIKMSPGDLLAFDAMNCLHGNMPNDTGATRMSIDFRVIPEHLFEGSDRKSINTGLKFDIGGYYATTREI